MIEDNTYRWPRQRRSFEICRDCMHIMVTRDGSPTCRLRCDDTDAIQLSPGLLASVSEDDPEQWNSLVRLFETEDAPPQCCNEKYDTIKKLREL